MAWERGYYYRVRKVRGRVVREYVGRASLAELAAQLDAIQREERQLARLDERMAKADLQALEDDIKALTKTADLVARAALLAAGLHQHKRGEWRRRREPDRPAEAR